MIGNITEISAFATFTATEFNNWKTSIKAVEQAVTQTLKQNTHTNHANIVHSNTGSHYDRTRTSTRHSNSGGTHRNSDNHKNGSRSHSNAGRHSNATRANGDHYDRVSGDYSKESHYDQSVHSDSETSHRDNSYETDSHSNTDSHANTKPTVHTNAGFNHQNYVPSKTYIMNIANNTKLKGSVKMGFYAYDKNIDGHGTQDVPSKDVRYNVKIRKIKKLNGTAEVTGYRQLLNWVATDNVTINTIDPLATGNTNKTLTEGYYEIVMQARNEPKTELGVTQTYEGTATTITVMIKQNELPTVVATNKSSSIGYSFSEFGASNPSNTVSKTYEDDLYSEGATYRDGLLIVMNIKDIDGAQNWLKGKGRLVDTGGTTIAGTHLDIVFANNNSTVINANGANQKAYYFVPKSVIKSIPSMDGVKVELAISDYENAACTVPTGDVIVQQVIGGGDNTVISVNVDNTKPIINFSKNEDTWKMSNIVKVNSTDAKNIFKTEYQWIKKGESIVEANYKVFVNNTDILLDKPPTGIYQLVVRTTDMARNTLIKTSGEFFIDNTDSIITHTLSTTEIVNTDVTIFITATDADSGVDKIRVKDSTWVTDNKISLTVPQNGDYFFEVLDKAGHLTEYKVTVNNIDKEPPKVEDGGIIIRKTKLDGSKGYIEFNKDKITDNYTPTPEIVFKTDTLDWTRIRSGISDVLSGNTKKVTLKDKVGNESEFTINVIDDWDLGSQDTDNTSDDKIKEIQTLSPTIPEPTGGTHYSISFDGVTWSDWEPKQGKPIDVNLPGGEGYKGVYVRVGVQQFKDTPISTKNGISYVREELEEIIPIDVQDRYHYAYDKTAPTVEVKSTNNLWISDKDHKIPLTMAIEDNMSEKVSVTISLLDKGGNQIGDASNFTVDTGVQKNLTIDLDEGGLYSILKPDENKSGTAILKIEVKDSSGNTKKVIKSIIIK